MINELIKNRTQSGEMTETEKVLGDLSRVYRVADFWDTNADLIELIAANELLGYAQTGDFTKEEFDNFRKGLYSMGIFMSKCANDRKQIEDLKIAGKVYKRELSQ